MYLYCVYSIQYIYIYIKVHIHKLAGRDYELIDVGSLKVKCAGFINRQQTSVWKTKANSTN